jgi:hypothetical protein
MLILMIMLMMLMMEINPSDFITSSGFVSSTPLNVVIVTSTNVVPNTTESFVPPQIEIILPPYVFSSSAPFENDSNSYLHSPLSDDDSPAIYDDLTSSALAHWPTWRTNRFNKCIFFFWVECKSFFFFLFLL